MTASGISASGLSDYNSQNTFQLLQQEFQQLGKDLQAGNLTAAESDFVTLQQDLPQDIAAASAAQSSAAASSQSNDPIAQAFAQLGSDLQAGNLTAAQQDYTKIQQDFQSAASQGSQATEGHHHHHHHSDSSNSSGSNPISQLLTELGQELKSGSLAAAQQTYQSLEQDLKQFSPDSSQQAQSSSASSSSSVSVSA
jgi:outer membrane protein assembly factor BamD (BamD/ComL family)